MFGEHSSIPWQITQKKQNANISSCAFAIDDDEADTSYSTACPPPLIKSFASATDFITNQRHL